MKIQNFYHDRRPFELHFMNTMILKIPRFLRKKKKCNQSQPSRQTNKNYYREREEKKLWCKQSLYQLNHLPIQEDNSSLALRF